MFIEINARPKMIIELDLEELDALEYAYQIIDKIAQISKTEQTEELVLDSSITGECIEVKEFGRVLGILGGIIKHNGEEWDMIEKKKIPSIDDFFDF